MSEASEQQPGEGWNDGMPSNWKQLRMFFCGGLFVLGVFSFIFMVLGFTQAAGIRYRELVGTESNLLVDEGSQESELAVLDAARAGLATLSWHDVAIAGILLGPLLLARRSRLSVSILLATLALAYAWSAGSSLSSLLGYNSAWSEANSWVSVLLMSLITLFAAVGFFVVQLPGIWKRED